jgi:hypothetical protein
MRPLLFAYPLSMVFTVLYCAVHYFVDVLAGWGYVLATFALVDVIERWRQHNIGVTDRGRHRHQTRRIPGYHRRVVLTGLRSLSPLLAAGVGHHANQALADHAPQCRDPGLEAALLHQSEERPRSAPEWGGKALRPGKTTTNRGS